MTRKARSAPAPAKASEADPLAASVDRLTTAVGALSQVLDEIREDFSWVTRNGVPVQPIEHVVVKRMALDPCAKDWGDRLQLQRFTCSANESASPLDSDMLDRIAAELTRSFEGVAEGQLEIILTALDGVREQILAALKRNVRAERIPPISNPSSSSPVRRNVSTPPPESPPPGRLF